MRLFFRDTFLVIVLLLVLLELSASQLEICSDDRGECSDETGLLHLRAASQARAEEEAMVATRVSQTSSQRGMRGPLASEEDIDASAKSHGGANPIATSRLLRCILITCMNSFNPHAGKACMNCLEKNLNGTTMGVNGIPISYALGMMKIPLSKSPASSTYVNAWCDGNLEGCTTKENYPGVNTTSVMDYQSVVALGSQYPKKEWSGQWWRGNELGFIINDPSFWSKRDIDPFALLGILPSQHAAIRPLMERMFGHPGAAVQKIVDDMTADFLERKAEVGLDVPNDLKAFVYQLLNKIALKRDVTEEQALDFVSLQTKIVGLATVTQILPGWAYSYLDPVNAEIAVYLAEYEQIVESLYGEELAKEDCAPSKSCRSQMASGVFDALYAAGGLSVPTNIATGLGLLFSKSETNPFPQGSYPKSKALNFDWENIRYFAPVVGFPHWSTRPVCAGLTAEQTAALNKPEGRTKACPLGTEEESGVNQYQGGTRVVPNLALAQRDPSIWGTNANDFVIRKLSDYKKSVGFAEMAVDDKVADGRMNRACPGKTLALMMGEAFFKAFDKSEWAEPSIPITFGSGPTYVSSFVLSSKKMVEE